MTTTNAELSASSSGVRCQLAARARFERPHELQPVSQGVIVEERWIEAGDLLAGDVQLERIERSTRRRSAQRLGRPGDGARDAVRRLEQRRKLTCLDRPAPIGAT